MIFYFRSRVQVVASGRKNIVAVSDRPATIIRHVAIQTKPIRQKQIMTFCVSMFSFKYVYHWFLKKCFSFLHKCSLLSCLEIKKNLQTVVHYFHVSLTLHLLHFLNELVPFSFLDLSIINILGYED